MAAFAWLPKSTATSDGPLPSSRLNFLRFNCILIELCDRDRERRSRSNSRTPFSDFQPTTQPTKSMSCMTSACFGSPRGLVSYCNTYPRHLDTVALWALRVIRILGSNRLSR